MNGTKSLDAVLDFIHSLALSTSGKMWIADHLYEEVKAEEKIVSAVKPKLKMSDKEKDALFFSVAGAWKDDTVGDDMLEAIHIGRQSAGYERKLAYFDENE